MAKYEYKKAKGYNQKKFVENGHTMFDEDVLRRLKRLAYIEQHDSNSLLPCGFNKCAIDIQGEKACDFCSLSKNKQKT